MRAVTTNTLFAAAGEDAEGLDVIVELIPSGFRLSAYSDDGTLVQEILSYEEAVHFPTLREAARDVRRRANVRKIV